MTGSRAPAAIDALVALWTPLFPSNPVFDGPTLAEDYRDALFVGYDGDPDGEREAVASTSKWAGIGVKKRDETIVIMCSAVAISGDGIPKDARDRAYALYNTAEAALRANPSVSQSPTPFVAEIVTVQMLWDWLETSGLQARIAFSVHVETRI